MPPPLPVRLADVDVNADVDVDDGELAIRGVASIVSKEGDLDWAGDEARYSNTTSQGGPSELLLYTGNGKHNWDTQS